LFGSLQTRPINLHLSLAHQQLLHECVLHFSGAASNNTSLLCKEGNLLVLERKQEGRRAVRSGQAKQTKTTQGAV
jgi:hypothetical protein